MERTSPLEGEGLLCCTAGGLHATVKLFEQALVALGANPRQVFDDLRRNGGQADVVLASVRELLCEWSKHSTDRKLEVDYYRSAAHYCREANLRNCGAPLESSPGKNGRVVLPVREDFFGEELKRETAIVRLREERGRAPADLETLLCFAGVDPLAQLRHRVVAILSDMRVAVLDASLDNGKYVRVEPEPFDYPLEANWWFLTVQVTV